MLNQRYRPVVHAVPAIALIWLLAGAGYRVAQSTQVTPDRVLAYEQSVNFAALTGTARADAILKLEGMITFLSLNERQQVWPDIITRWFAPMTDAERTQFLTATALPGFKQTPNPLDLMPPDQRQQALDEALKKLQAARAQMLTEPATNPPAAAPQ